MDYDRSISGSIMKEYCCNHLTNLELIDSLELRETKNFRVQYSRGKRSVDKKGASGV